MRNRTFPPIQRHDVYAHLRMAKKTAVSRRRTKELVKKRAGLPTGETRQLRQARKETATAVDAGGQVRHLSGRVPRLEGIQTGLAAIAFLAVALAAASWKWPEEPILRNGFHAACRTVCRALGNSAAAAWRSPVRALPVLRAAAILTVTCTAGCSVFHAPSGPSGMEKQIIMGERVGAATQAHALRPASGSAAEPSLSSSRRKVAGREVTAIGDSVMAAGAMALDSVLPGIYIDAKPDRQMPAGLDIVRSLADSGRLRPVVVVGLGTNYIVTTSELRQLMQLIGPYRKLVLINTYVPDGWSKEVNATIAAFIRQHPGIVLADWFDTIKQRTYLLWPDQVHPQMPGTIVYARMVYRAVQVARDIPRPTPAAQPVIARRAIATPPPPRQRTRT
jgi:hypothetical protein